MRTHTASAYCIGITLMVLSRWSPAATVELDVIPSSRAPLGAVQDWARELAGLKGVRVRAGGSARSAKPSVKQVGNSVHITSVIGSQKELIVPGRRFTLRQRAALAAWIDQQRAGTPQGKATKTKDRFGLTTADLKRLHAALKPPLTFSTTGKNARRVVSAIEQLTGARFDLTPEAASLLNRATVSAELKNISSGTALAAILRPLELVFAPQTTAGGTKLNITREGSVAEAWPVGWPPQGRDREVLPKLFDFLEIEIDGAPIADVLDSVGPRLGTPIIYDDAMLQLKRIDPAKTEVSLPPGRTFYGKILSQSLFNARLDYELRVDERGKPFLWITPLTAK
jgi:hypothetical protein